MRGTFYRWIALIEKPLYKVTLISSVWYWHIETKLAPLHDKSRKSIESSANRFNTLQKRLTLRTIPKTVLYSQYCLRYYDMRTGCHIQGPSKTIGDYHLEIYPKKITDRALTTGCGWNWHGSGIRENILYPFSFPIGKPNIWIFGFAQVVRNKDTESALDLDPDPSEIWIGNRNKFRSWFGILNYRY